VLEELTVAQESGKMLIRKSLQIAEKGNRQSNNQKKEGKGSAV
jgi:hypothetical protein